MRRLFFVAPSYYVLTGLGTWLDYLLPGLEKRGYFCQLGLVAGILHNPKPYLAAHPFNRVTLIKNRTGSAMGRIMALDSAIQLVRPDAVISVNIPDSIRAAAWTRSKMSSSPHKIMTIHGIEADLISDCRQFEQLLDGVICTNKLTVELIKQVAGIHMDRVHYAAYGVPTVGDLQARTSKRKNGVIRIACVGRIENDQKRVMDLPKVCRHLVNLGVEFELWIIGTGPDEEELKGQLEPYERTERVRYLGFVPPQEMSLEVYGHIDALLVTSQWETGPIIIWEAFSHGIPVVTSKYIGSGLEGSLSDGDNCLMFEIGDAKTAAKKIAQLASSSGALDLVAGGNRLLNERYNTEHSIDAWASSIEMILGREPIERDLDIPFVKSGRLDRLFGANTAEFVRSFFGIRHLHTDAGSEWPHALNSNPSDENFWRLASQLDRGNVRAAHTRTR